MKTKEAGTSPSLKQTNSSSVKSQSVFICYPDNHLFFSRERGGGSCSPADADGGAETGGKLISHHH